MFRLIPPMLLAAVLSTVAAIGLATAQPINGEGLWNGSVSFDQKVQQYVTQHGLPGATVAVTKGGKLVLSKGYGYADLASGTPMLASHATYIGSTSKVITAIGALALVEAGKLDLEGRVYGSGTPLWPGDASAPPSGILLSGASILKDPGDYFGALREGVDNLSECYPPSDCPTPSLLGATLYRATMNNTLEWASSVRLKHLLSHTAGLRGSYGSGAEDVANEEYDEVTYKEVHLVILRALMKDGDGKPIPPFFAAPETVRDYANHGFGVTGLIISETSGMSYEDYIRQRVLDPLGLHNLVRGGTALSLYATSYAKKKHPFVLDAWTPEPQPYVESTFGLPTGGWVGTAGDLVRLMCGLDRKTTAPILKASTVTTMETIAYPSVDSAQPLGWDQRSGDQLRKNGDIGYGASQIVKFLPGALGPDEINVAIAMNIGDLPSDVVTFLNSLAAIVAAVEIPPTYDLFDPKYPCYVGAIAGTVTLRDNSPTAPECPRPAEVAASIRTNNAGEVPYVLTCTGDGRKWEGTMTAHQTDEDTFLGVVVHPIEITKQEEITCVLRKGEVFGLADILDTGKRHYPCQMASVAVPEREPPPPEPPKNLVPKAQEPPKIVCEGGKVATRGKPPKPYCDCPRGTTAQKVPPGPLQALARELAKQGSVAAEHFRCVRAAVVITCTGGTVQGTQCICPSRWTRQTVANTPTAKVYNCKPPALLR